MKKLLITLAILVIIAGTAYFAFMDESDNSKMPDLPLPVPPSSSEPAESEEIAPLSEPDETDEAAAAKQAVADLLDSLKSWDEAAIDKLMAELLPGQTLPPTYKSIFQPICESLEYELGNAKVTGDTAIVDVSITSLDARSALNKVLSGAVTYVAAKRLTGAAGSAEEHLIDYLADKIDWKNVSTIRTNASVHLTRGGDGAWKIDASDADNLGFVDAITGGAVEVFQDLQKLAAQFQ